MIERASKQELSNRLHLRDEAAAVVDLARHLPNQDRLIIEAVYARGFTYADLSRIAGGSTSRMSRKVRQLLIRMKSDEYAAITRLRDVFPASVYAVGKAIFVDGMTLSEAGQVTGNTLHQVRSLKSQAETIAAIYAKRGCAK